MQQKGVIQNVVELLAQLGKNMRDFILLENFSYDNPMTRNQLTESMLWTLKTLRAYKFDINEVTASDQEFSNVSKDALPAYLHLGTLAYKYLSKINNFKFEGVCAYLLQAFDYDQEPSGPASRAAMLTMLFPMKNLVYAYVLLGQRGLQALEQAKIIKRTNTGFDFLKSKKEIAEQSTREKAKYLKHQIEPLCLFINQGESQLKPLSTDTFEHYLKTNLTEEHQDSATEQGLTLTAFFDSNQIPLNEHHMLRDNFIGETLPEELDVYHEAGKNLLSFFKGELSYSKLESLSQDSVPEIRYG